MILSRHLVVRLSSIKENFRLYLILSSLEIKHNDNSSTLQFLHLDKAAQILKLYLKTKDESFCVFLYLNVLKE